MHWETVQQNWQEYKGRAKEKWGKLTDEDLNEIAGDRDLLISKLQERYGASREQAEVELKEFAYSPKI